MLLQTLPSSSDVNAFDLAAFTPPLRHHHRKEQASKKAVKKGTPFLMHVL
jgi:hypothetical protein